MSEYKRDILTPDASYMLVGGLGGLGRAVASWMIEHGACHIIFVNRSGLSRQESKDVVATLQAKGAKVAVYGCDVASEQAVNDMASQAAKEMPPIRGVIQGAMVLKVSFSSRK
jgi:NAD(P)-dependent dehydrogenase (short-subunit alcohol dehydrogenase family)